MVQLRNLRPRLPGLLLLSLLACAGCFHERSFPMRMSDFQTVAAVQPLVSASTVTWLEQTHGELQHLLPAGRAALLTRELAPAGHAIDVFDRFEIDQQQLSSVLFNFSGLMDSAQVTRNRPDSGHPPAGWDGFRDTWVPITSDLQLAARIGLAMHDGRPRDADCIVLIPGLFGSNDLQRTREIAQALVAGGLHVLALEPRGTGQTRQRFPETYTTYGLLEIGDLYAVDDWLQQFPFVRETGLIGFSWGANQVLLLAWDEGHAESVDEVAPRLRTFQQPRTGRRHYRAGVIAFSPVIGFEELLDRLASNWSLLANPVLNKMQVGIRARWRRVSDQTANGDLGGLIAYEAHSAGLTYPAGMDDGLAFLRLLWPTGRAAGNKLDSARMPVLIVNAANDPIASAQRVCDLFEDIDNPGVAALILEGGGHNGFVAYARAYFYNLILHFFGGQVPVVR